MPVALGKKKAMAGILDLGIRVELTSMYPHLHDISIGLYERSNKSGTTEFQVHSYAARDGVNDCLRHVAAAMVILGEWSWSEMAVVRFGLVAEISM